MIAHALQAEPLDALVWRVTGRGPEALRAVLDANPGLAAAGSALAEGTAVTIPDLAPAAAVVEIVQLWD